MIDIFGKRERNFLILVVFIVFLLLGMFFLIYPGINMFEFNTFSVREFQGTTTFIPEVESGREIQAFGYKHSNDSGILVSAPSEIHCSWKTEGEDDGWKECEAIFEIQDNKFKKILSSPNVELSFEDSESVRNIQIDYSDDYEISEEIYVDSLGEEEILELRKKDGAITFSSASKMGKKRPIERIKEDKKKVIVKQEKKTFNKRVFSGFSDFSDYYEIVSENISEQEDYENDGKSGNNSLHRRKVENPLFTIESQNYSLEQNVTFESNVSAQDSNSLGNEIDENNASDEENDADESEEAEMINETEGIGVEEDSESEYEKDDEGIDINETETYGITGFSLFSESGINTEKPFAIRVRFEIPKYSSNRFDFEINEGEFEAFIDPDVSACGSLDSPGTYFLDQDIEAGETCFIVSANDVTLDCQGHRIDYSSSGDGYGIYSDADFTTIRNCLIVDGNSSGNKSAIYFSGNNGEIVDNTLITYVDNGEGVYAEGDNNNISGNSIITHGRYSHCVYSIDSSSNFIEGNTFTTNYWDAYGIFLDSSSENYILRNNITTLDEEAYLIRLSNSDNNVISENNLTDAGQLGYPLYFHSESNYNNISNNLIFVHRGDGAGINLNSSFNNFINNTIITHGTGAFGIEALSDAANNTFEKNNITTFGSDSYALYLISSFNNNFSENKFTTYGLGGFVVALSTSNSNFFSRDSIISYGEWAAGVLMEGPTDGNYFLGINATTYNSGSEIFYVYNQDHNFSVQDSYINCYSGAEEVYLESSLVEGTYNFTNVSLFDSRWDLATTGNLVVSNYLDVFTNFTNDSYANAPITGYASDNSEVFSEHSSTNGTLRVILLDYIKTNYSNVIFYSNYNINASLGDESFGSSLNLSESHSLSFTFNSTLYESYQESSFPNIECIDCPVHGSTQSNTDVFLNVSSSSRVSNLSTFIDFDNSLVGWWRMDDTNGNEVVDYIGENNGFLGGDAEQINSGKLGRSVEFDGDEDYVNLGNVSAFYLGDTFSIVLWIKTQDFSGQPSFIGRVDKGGVYNQYWYLGKKWNESKVEARLGDGSKYSSVYSSLDIVDGYWHQVVWVRNRDSQEIYIDGTINIGDLSIDSGIGNVNSGTDVYLGGDLESYDYWFNGSLDDLLIFNRSLSPMEIATLYTNKSNGNLERNFEGLVEGTHTFKAYTQDLDGRINATGSSEFSVDLGYVPINPLGDGRNSNNSCKPDWNCSEWGECIDGKQIRTCDNLNKNCDIQRPDSERSCEVKEVLEKEKKSKGVLFDINLNLLKNSLVLSEKLTGTLTLINLGVPGKVKANLTYEIFDEKGNTIYEEKEIVPVETQIEFIKVIDTSEFSEGEYSILVDLEYEGQTEPANAQEKFIISETNLNNIYGFVFVTLILLILFVSIVLVFFRIIKQIKK